MRISLARGPREPLSRETAWGCLTSNLALPGTGSLLAGRVSGYGQLLLTLIGFTMSFIFGVRFLLWQFSNWTRLHSAEADPYEALLESWPHLRWALLGLGIFIISFLWALITSLGILASARKTQTRSEPPSLA